MIRRSETLPDPRSTDSAGTLIQVFNSEPSWTKQRRQLREILIKELKKLGYIKFVTNIRNFALCGVGDSILYQVPPTKTGHLKPFRGKHVRIVCIARDRKSTIMAGPYLPEPIKIRFLCSARFLGAGLGCYYP